MLVRILEATERTRFTGRRQSIPHPTTPCSAAPLEPFVLVPITSQRGHHVLLSAPVLVLDGRMILDCANVALLGSLSLRGLHSVFVALHDRGICLQAVAVTSLHL
jgi:hypothetical protein